MPAETLAAGIHPLALSNNRAGGSLEIAWSDGMTAMLPHRLLREACRCAHCTASARAGTPVRAADGVRVIAAEAYGANVLRLLFDDGHQRGLYPFAYLRSLQNRESAIRSRCGQQENELANPSRNSGLR